MEKLMRVTNKFVHAHIRKELNVLPIETLLSVTHNIIKDLKLYPLENRNQIKYYTKFWNLLIEY